MFNGMLFYMQNIDNPARGKFIVLYGINNLGKTTQAKLLVEKLQSQGLRSEYVKYPIYELQPSGVLLNNYLRGGNIYRLAAREAQILYALNRTQFEPVIREKLNQGISIVAEDYTGTGLAWGMGAGVDEQFLKYINSHLLKEDVAILMDGQRFSQAIEKNHEHETNDELTNRVRLMHLKLAEEFDWPTVNANQSIENVQKDIYKHVQTKLSINADTLTERLQQSYPLPEKARIEMRRINSTNDSNALPKILEKKNNPTAELSGSPNYFKFRATKVTLDAKLPTRAHDDDAGFDLYANENCTLLANDIVALATGVRLAIPPGYAGLIWDKSGLALKGLKTMGGVIDAGFRGEVKVVAMNVSGDILHIAKGQKIAQILFQKIEAPDLVESGELDETERMDNGFGSTGTF
jgi:dUTP pyrophosphatase